MNIDILFLDDKLGNYEEYIEEIKFKEYCETHSFKGEINQIISVPPS